MVAASLHPAFVPVPRATLVGRQAEIADALDLLREAAVPLLTLTGSGGVGKTRLALAIADEAVQSFADGMVFVDLSPIRDPSLVLSTIAQALGIREMGDRSPAELLQTLLRPRQMLLILDNCEQILEAASDIALLLAGCPRLQVLATSRAPLHIRGEHELSVPPLALPATDDATGNELAQIESVALFLQRAWAVKHSFTPTEEELGVIAQICRRVDGLPLAIELAAARINMLSPGALLARLSDRLQLLTGGRRDAPARQRTLRDTIGWSYDLLTGGEQRLFRRLAVFVGGCSLDAILAVCTASNELAGDPLDRVAPLVDRNLLRAETPPGADGPWLTMLETIREFALERLIDSGEEAEIRRRHVEYVESIVGASDPELRPWLERLTINHGNIRAALGWLNASGRSDAFLRLTTSLWAFWYVRGHLREGMEWLSAALEQGGEAPPALRAEGLAALAALSKATGDNERAIALCEEGLAIARATGDAYPAAMLLDVMAEALAYGRGAWDTAISLLEEAVALAREARTGRGSWLLPHALADFGLVLVAAGEAQRGVPLLEEALALHHAARDWVGAGMRLAELGLAAGNRVDPSRAAARYRESLALLWADRDAMLMHIAIIGLAALAAECGRPAEAGRLLGTVEEIRERTGTIILRQFDAVYLRAKSLARRQLGDLAYDEAVAAGRRLALPDAVAEALALADALSGATNRSPDDVPKPHGLSPREVEILRLVVAGKTNPEIADTLFISYRTVTTHVTHLYAKLGVTNRAEAVSLAVRESLV